MTHPLSEIREIRSEFSDWLIRSRSQPLLAIGVGYKETQGILGNEECIQVHIDSKRPRADLARSLAIPKWIDGVPTDVRVSAIPRFMALGARPTPAEIAEAVGQAQHRARTRPLVPGISCANQFVPAGTLGHFCRRKGSTSEDVYLLSSGHVLRGKSAYKTSASILQAAPSDGGNLQDTVAKLSTTLPLRQHAGSANLVDAAVAKLLEGIPYSTSIPKIGRLRGRANAQLGMRVGKVGRSTGYTQGIVTAIDYETVIPWGWRKVSEYYPFRNQIRIEPTEDSNSFGRFGDSGAIVFTKDRREALGLFFAGAADGSYGLASPIRIVERELRIELLV